MKPPCKKRRKVQKEEDRISKLPDEILVSILCFLSTEEAAKTSVLSRRWEKLWLNKIVNSPSLDLYINKLMKLPLYRVNDSETYDYIKRVNQFIKLHQLPMLDEFTIGFHLDSRHSDDIDTWVEFAAKKQVKILKLEFGITCFSPRNGELPNYDIKFLANIRMYGLRDLFLGRVNVGENMLESVISNSPLLERLSVGVSVLFEKLEIVATNLKYLMLDACSNLRHLKISAPNLNMMELFSFERLNHIDISAPNLSTASLTLFLPNLRFFWYHEMLAHLPQVKILKLTTTTLGIWKMEDVPELSKVEHLEIYLYEVFRVPFGWSCHLLQAVPFLHSLSIKLDKCEYDDLKLEDIDFLWMLEDIPKKVKVEVEAEGSPSHQYLKVVELIGFSGCRNEIESLLQLFEGAVSLEKIIIQVCRSSDQYAKLCLECAELLKAHMRSKLDVVII